VRPPSAATWLSRICSARRRTRHGEDNRRVSNFDQVSRVAALAMKRGKSVDFSVVNFAQIREGSL